MEALESAVLERATREIAALERAILVTYELVIAMLMNGTRFIAMLQRTELQKSILLWNFSMYDHYY